MGKLGRDCLWHKETRWWVKRECTHKQHVKLIDYVTVDSHYNGLGHLVVMNPNTGFVWSAYIRKATRFSFNEPVYSRLSVAVDSTSGLEQGWQWNLVVSAASDDGNTFHRSEKKMWPVTLPMSTMSATMDNPHQGWKHITVSAFNCLTKSSIRKRKILFRTVKILKGLRTKILE